VDALTRAAVTGTSREAPPARTLPTDDLLQSAKTSPERDLLLRAGMQAVYKTAGGGAETGVKAPDPAPEETLPACSARAAELVLDLLMRSYDPQDYTNCSLLVEALERLQSAGFRLPASLLPISLDGDRPRKPLLPVLGERGRWISGLNPVWRWVEEMDAPGDEETIWEEGALSQRLAVLERIRRREPACGREWLAGVWRQEKAETRNAMIRKLETGLSEEDEPFLERALDDKSKGVRTTAARLLSRLPTSAYATRAVARADTILVAYERPSGFGFSRRARAGGLTVESPSAEDEGWKRDLRGGEAPRGRDSLRRWVGEKAERIMQALSVVPPRHWEEKFGAEPEDLISAAASSDWEAVVLAGWNTAASRYQDRGWALPLWERCYDILEEPDERGIAWSSATRLASLLPRARIAEKLRGLRRNEDMPRRLAQTLGGVPPPWEETLSCSYREAVEKRLRTLSFASHENPYMWWGTLREAATRLPTTHLESLDITLPDEPRAGQSPTLLADWRRELRKFEETLELRRKLVEEIPL
jgi:hypothetical protein